MLFWSVKEFVKLPCCTETDCVEEMAFMGIYL